jgi:A/G-specific adenine glycosylase
MHEQSQLLYIWYMDHKRDLPWRTTSNPYHIWVSEVILQQTRIDQGLGYYDRFLERFPDIQSLATAEEGEVLRLWQGLGYYRRAINMHKAARLVMDRHNGEMPVDYQSLITLPGIGDYTASIISSVCSGEQRPALDGNVKRFISRLFHLTENPESTTGKRVFKAMASLMMSGRDPGLANNAMMEFGALQCIPQKPACGVCPFRGTCLALKDQQVHLLPAKAAKRTIRKRYFTYCIFSWYDQNQEYLLVRKRHDQDIWANMYEFPYIEYETGDEEPGITDSAISGWCLAPSGTILAHSPRHYTHPLTHQLITASYLHFRLPSPPARIGDGLMAVTQTEFQAMAKPKLIIRMLKDGFDPL